MRPNRAANAQRRQTNVIPTQISERMKNLSPAKRELLLQKMREQQGAVAGAQSIPKRDTQEPPPLSFARERLWFLHQMLEDKSPYNMPAQVLLSGELDVAALERAFNEVVRRHESLRTSFSDSAGTPRQVIAPELPVALAVTDLSHLAPDERAAQAAALADSEARLPFDLSRPPLFRAALLRLSATEHHLLLTLHHVVADGWSIRVLVRELSALYESFRASVAAPLPALPIQYADYSVWQREWLAGAELERQLGYWRERLRSAPPLLEIPADRPRPAVQSFRGARLPVKLSASVATAVKDFARSGGATSFMVLLAAFEALLWRYTGQDDIVIGTPVANRNRAEVEGLIGYFANTLVLRTDLSGGPTFRQLVDRVRETSLGALAHQDLPFEKLVEEL
ncbi:MAG TPA: condensation domain-containing protein, partial [Pyrinomonadaceae bacterium]